MLDPTSTPLRGSPRARSTRSIGDPLGLDRLDRSGIPEGSIDSIHRESLRGDPLGLDRIDSIDRGSLRARSTRSIEDSLGLDRLDRSAIPEGSIDSIDRGSLRARSTRSIGDPLGLDRLDRSGIPEGSIDSLDRGSPRDRLDRSGMMAILLFTIIFNAFEVLQLSARKSV